MTKWILTLEAPDSAADSKVLKIMQFAARQGLRYSVVSKEMTDVAEPRTEQIGRVGGLVREPKP